MPRYDVTIRTAADESRTFGIDVANPNALGGMIAAYVAQSYGPGCTLRGVCGETTEQDEKSAGFECSEKLPMHPGKVKPTKPSGVTSVSKDSK